jgi:thiazole synthase
MTVAENLSVRVNGEPRQVTRSTTVAQMLSELGIDPRKVAVERNLEIVPRAALGEVSVADGDTFEIVHFVGGG